MKILTICIPCNEQTKSIHSLMESIQIQKEFIEVLFITQEISNTLQNDIDIWKSRMPNCIKVIERSKEIKPSISGLYFKLVSPDFQLEQAGLVKVVSTLQSLLRSQVSLDVLISDYEFKTNDRKRDIQDFHAGMVQEDILEWHQMKTINQNRIFDSKCMIFKSNIITKYDLNVFYDSIYNQMALPIYILGYAKTFLYSPGVLLVCNKVDATEYLEQVSDGIYYAKNVIDEIDISDIKSRKARHYVAYQLNVLLLRIVSTLINEGSIDSLQKKEELWFYLKINNYVLYKQCKKYLIAKLIGSESNTLTNQIIKRMK